MQDRSETWTEEMVSTSRFKCQFTKIWNNQTVKSSNQNEDWKKKGTRFAVFFMIFVYLQELIKWKSGLKIAIQIWMWSWVSANL